MTKQISPRMNSKVLRLTCWLLMVWLLQACSDAGVAQMPSQQWQDLNIILQTRPTQLEPGMTEFLIIATTPRGLPGHDMVVSLGRTTAGPWSQAIQDGHSGVYRRAFFIQAGQPSVMLQLRQGKDKTVLTYPLLWPE